MKHALYFLNLIPMTALIANGSPTAQVTPDHAMKCSVDASFTYWCAKEDGLNIAESALLAPSATTSLASQGTVFKQSSGYEPGFKVGIGLESTTHWQLHAEYTYFRSSQFKSKSAPETDIDSLIGVWKVNNWFLQSTLLRQQPLTGTHISSKWHLAMDMGDLLLSRPSLQKTDFSFSPFAGLRTIWFRQKMNVYLTQAATSVGGPNFLPPQPLESLNNSNAWSIGPRIGVAGNYLLPQGFRIEGLLATSLLYTKFTKIEHSEGWQSTLVLQSLTNTSMDPYNCVRPVLDVGLGLGWETNFHEKYNFDLSASYDFSYFWGQNMMRPMLDEFATGSATGDNDLSLQGLTVTACVRF